MLFIVYINTFLQKNVFFPHDFFFILIYGHFLLPNYCPFELNFDGKFCLFFKRLLNFRTHALHLELNKVLYTNFVKFQLQSMSSIIE